MIAIRGLALAAVLATAAIALGPLMMGFSGENRTAKSLQIARSR